MLGFAAKARSEIGDRADRAIICLLFIAYAPKGGVTVGDADSEAKLITEAKPFTRQTVHSLAHCESHPNRTFSRVCHFHWVIEKEHHAVAGQALKGPAVFDDQPTHLVMVLLKHVHHFFGLEIRSESREAL